MLQLFCKDYGFNNLFLLYLIFTGEPLPHLPPLTARPWLFSSCEAFAQLYNFTSCKEQQRAEGERVRQNERECTRERGKRVENERFQKLEKRDLSNEGEFLTCSKNRYHKLP